MCRIAKGEGGGKCLEFTSCEVSIIASIVEPLNIGHFVANHCSLLGG